MDGVHVDERLGKRFRDRAQRVRCRPRGSQRQITITRPGSLEAKRKRISSRRHLHRRAQPPMILGEHQEAAATCADQLSAAHRLPTSSYHSSIFGCSAFRAALLVLPVLVLSAPKPAVSPSSAPSGCGAEVFHVVKILEHLGVWSRCASADRRGSILPLRVASEEGTGVSRLNIEMIALSGSLRRRHPV